MSHWSNEELYRIGDTEEIQVTSLRQDGTLRKWTTIWTVRLGDNLFIRSVNGENGAWYRGALDRHQGRIRAGSLEKDVKFQEVSNLETIQQVDNAYRTKYSRYPQYVSPMLTAESRSTTLKLIPRNKDS